MPDKPKYYDIRSDFWRRHFEEAAHYTRYLADSDPEKAARWVDMGARICDLSAEQRERVTGHHRRINILVYSGVWCGDCVRQGPMIESIAAACGPDVEVRWIDRSASPELTDELRILGAMRVPVVLFLSEDFHEIGRFGDRMLSTYRAKAAREVGPACSSGIVPPPADELAEEMADWVDIFERMLLMARLAPPLRRRYGD